MTAAQQLGLLDEHGRVHAVPRRTEVIAAESVNAKSQRAKVLQLLREAPAGLTDDEGGRLLGQMLGTNDDRLRFGRRRNELERAGLVVATTQTRPSQYGRPATVWKAVQS